jgi:hypothetical protein
MCSRRTPSRRWITPRSFSASPLFLTPDPKKTALNHLVMKRMDSVLVEVVLVSLEAHLTMSLPRSLNPVPILNPTATMYLLRSLSPRRSPGPIPSPSPRSSLKKVKKTKNSKGKASKRQYDDPKGKAKKTVKKVQVTVTSDVGKTVDEGNSYWARISSDPERRMFTNSGVDFYFT